MMGLKFAYASNGKEIIEHDFITGAERNISDFPSPDELWGRLRRTLRLPTPRDQADALSAYFEEVGGKTPRYYQQVAINRAVNAVLGGQERILLTMTTGCVKICYNINMNQLKIKIPKAELAEFCKRWNVSEFSVFGSALRSDFRPDSDLDVLVSFAPQAQVSLFDMVHMQDELKSIFGREVDLISKRGVENSRNYLRRKHILESAQVIHVA